MRDLHISVSQVRGYLRCSRQFQLSRVRGVEPAFVPSALAFGSAIHEGLALYYREHMAGHVPALTQVVEVFTAAWQRAAQGPVLLRLDEDESWDLLRQKGTEMLTVFAATQREPPMVEAVELPFEVDLHDVVTGELLEEKLVGTIDAVIREGVDVVILEHKTASRRYGEDQLRFDLQPTGYRLAARQLGMGDVRLRFQVLTKTSKPSLQVADVERGERDEADFLETAVGVLRAIDAGVFFPTRGWQCRTCPVAHACDSTARRAR